LIRRVVVLRAGLILAERSASATAPVVRIVSPNGGEQFSQDAVAFAWTSSDSDGDTVFHQVQYSADNGITWQTLLVDFLGQSFTLPRTALKGTANGLVRVIATDGFLSAEDQSDGVFSVGNHAPFLILLSPSEGQLFIGGRQVEFEAVGRDLEDGELTGANLVWSSNIDGTLGSGNALLKGSNDLSDGDHTITVTARDRAGLSTSASVRIRVAPAVAFYTVTPCRLVDTRETAGPAGGPPLASGQARILSLAGRCGVPPTARSVALNVTVTGSTSGGHVTLFPGSLRLPLASTINYRAGQTRANNALIRLDSFGKIAAFSGQPSGTVHLILDVAGYFE
jgi:hypothetical protein